MSDTEALQRKCDLLVRENASLRDRIQVLEDALSTAPTLPPILGLSRAEAAVLGAIEATTETASKDRIMAALYSTSPEDPPGEKIVDVYVCKVRKKLKRWGIEVQTQWGAGYYMTSESRSRLNTLRASWSGQSAQQQDQK